MDNLPLIQRGFASLPATVTEYYFRANSACYDARGLKWLANAQRAGGGAGGAGGREGDGGGGGVHARVADPHACGAPRAAHQRGGRERRRTGRRPHAPGRPAAPHRLGLSPLDSALPGLSAAPWAPPRERLSPRPP